MARGGSTVLAEGLGIRDPHRRRERQGLAAAGAQPHPPARRHRQPLPAPRRHRADQVARLPGSSAATWPKFHTYPMVPWDLARARGLAPDLVLVDGRFRAACFLASLLFARPGAVILFDDYVDRPFYHTVEAFGTPALHGRTHGRVPGAGGPRRGPRARQGLGDASTGRSPTRGSAKGGGGGGGRARGERGDVYIQAPRGGGLDRGRGRPAARPPRGEVKKEDCHEMPGRGTELMMTERSGVEIDLPAGRGCGSTAASEKI